MRTRIFYNHLTGEVTELSEEDLRKRLIGQHDGPSIIPDLDRAYGGGFVSPINGEYITSRSQLRRHERSNNVRHAGDFKNGDLVRKEQSRVNEIRQRAEGRSVEWK